MNSRVLLLAQAETPNRPATWAVPMETAGVPSLNKVDDVLYRIAQPSAVGMRNLRKRGIETGVNLRSFSSARQAPGGEGDRAGSKNRFEPTGPQPESACGGQALEPLNP